MFCHLCVIKTVYYFIFFFNLNFTTMFIIEKKTKFGSQTSYFNNGICDICNEKIDDVFMPLIISLTCSSNITYDVYCPQTCCCCLRKQQAFQTRDITFAAIFAVKELL